MFQSLFILACIKKKSIDSISDGELKLSDSFNALIVKMSQ